MRDTFEPRHDKTNKKSMRPVKTQIGLGICPVWSESSLSAWRKLGSSATHWVHREDSDQTGQMPKLRWVFAGCTLILLVLSYCGSIIIQSCLLQTITFSHHKDKKTIFEPQHDKTNEMSVRQMPRLIWVFIGCTCQFAGFVMRCFIYLLCSVLLYWIRFFYDIQDNVYMTHLLVLRAMAWAWFCTRKEPFYWKKSI